MHFYYIMKAQVFFLYYTNKIIDIKIYSLQFVYRNNSNHYKSGQEIDVFNFKFTFIHNLKL